MACEIWKIGKSRSGPAPPCFSRPGGEEFCLCRRAALYKGASQFVSGSLHNFGGGLRDEIQICVDDGSACHHRCIKSCSSPVGARRGRCATTLARRRSDALLRHRRRCAQMCQPASVFRFAPGASSMEPVRSDQSSRPDDGRSHHRSARHASEVPQDRQIHRSLPGHVPGLIMARPCSIRKPGMSRGFDAGHDPASPGRSRGFCHDPRRRQRQQPTLT